MKNGKEDKKILIISVIVINAFVSYSFMIYVDMLSALLRMSYTRDEMSCAGKQNKLNIIINKT